jgi:hypothetical protein
LNLSVAIALSPMFVCAIIGVFFFRNYQKVFKWFAAYIIYTFLQQLGAILYASQGHNNSWIFHIQAIVTSFFIGKVISELFQNENLRKRYLILRNIVCIVHVVVVLAVQPLNQFPSFNIGVGGLFITFGCFLYYMRLLDSPTEERIVFDPNFWLISSILLFYVPTFLLWLSINYFLANRIPIVPFNSLIYTSNFIVYSFFAVTLVLEERRSKKIASA